MNEIDCEKKINLIFIVLMAFYLVLIPLSLEGKQKFWLVGVFIWSCYLIFSIYRIVRKKEGKHEKSKK